jgi:hypothetical protein
VQLEAAPAVNGMRHATLGSNPELLPHPRLELQPMDVVARGLRQFFEVPEDELSWHLKAGDALLQPVLQLMRIKVRASGARNDGATVGPLLSSRAEYNGVDHMFVPAQSGLDFIGRDIGACRPDHPDQAIRSISTHDTLPRESVTNLGKVSGVENVGLAKKRDSQRVRTC